MGDDEKKEKGPKSKNFFYAVATVLLVVVVAYNLFLGLTVKKLGIPGIAEVEFGEKPKPTGATPETEVKQLPPEERQERQLKLVNDVKKVENPVEKIVPNQAANIVPDQPVSSTPVAANIAGEWETDMGLGYVITQLGNHITMQEVNVLYGVTMTGTGTITGRTLEIDYQTILGTVGRAVATLSEDGTEITGTFTDLTTGTPGVLYMYR